MKAGKISTRASALPSAALIGFLGVLVGWFEYYVRSATAPRRSR